MVFSSNRKGKFKYVVSPLNLLDGVSEIEASEDFRVTEVCRSGWRGVARGYFGEDDTGLLGTAFESVSSTSTTTVASAFGGDSFEGKNLLPIWLTV